MNPDLQNKIDQCIKLLKEAGVSNEIIAESFIPDETETEEEAIGSVMFAFERHAPHKTFADILSMSDKIIDVVFPERIIESCAVTDYTKKKFEEGEDVIQEIETREQPTAQ